MSNGGVFKTAVATLSLLIKRAFFRINFNERRIKNVLCRKCPIGVDIKLMAES